MQQFSRNQGISLLSRDHLWVQLIAFLLIYALVLGSIPLAALADTSFPHFRFKSTEAGFNSRVQGVPDPLPAKKELPAELSNSLAGDTAGLPFHGITNAAFHVALRPTALLETVTNAEVKPELECVVNNGNGSYTAQFGYENLNTGAVNIPVGSSNGFSPTPADRGQPTVFQPGRQRSAFSVTFDGSNLVWSLQGPDGIARTSKASSSSSGCDEDEGPVSNPGPAQTVSVGATVQLDGSGST
ncbi:MAG: hypothetical protein ACRD4F_04500, partial [Candidatus Angelobacter sp.]